MALGLLPLLFVQVVVHEGSHAVTMLLLGGTLTVFRPFVHRVEGMFAGGITSGDIPDEYDGYVCAAAPLTALALLATLRLIARRTADARLGVLLRLWLFGASFELVGNSLEFLSEGSDWKVLGRSFDLSETELRALIVLARLAVAAALLVPWPPMSSSRGAGTSALCEFAWVSALYSLLSTGAVSLSLLTHRPAFGDDPEFWTIVGMQGLSAVACAALASAGFVRRASGAASREGRVRP